MKHLNLFGMLLALAIAPALHAQITGTVLEDATGETIIGAAVVQEGTTNGTVTDIDGHFTLNVPAGTSLQFSYLGYTTQTLPAADGMVVRLAEATTVLKEVVAIGYGSQKKKEVTGAVSSMKAEDFNVGVKSNPVGLLQGKVAGLNISRSSADPTAGYNIQIRGFSTLGQGTGSSPLYIVDGLPTDNIANISQDEIASMDVLKDGSAAAIYGTRGTNGVIIITTKRGLQSNEDKFQTQVDYTAYASVSMPRGSTGMATAAEFRDLYNLSGGKIKPDLYTGPDGETYNTDWMALSMKKAAVTHNHNLAVSGGSRKFSYRAAVNYKYAEGLAKNNDRREINAKFAADQTALQGWLKLQYDFSYLHYRNDWDKGDFKQAAILNPTYPVYDNATESGFYYFTASGLSNPIESQQLIQNYQTGNYFRGSIKATVDIKAAPGLKVNGLVALEEGDDKTFYYCAQNYIVDRDGAGYASRQNNNAFKQLYEATVDYAGEWGGHTLTAVAGWSYQKFHYEYDEMNNKGFPTDYYQWYSMADGQTDKEFLTVSSNTNSNVLASGFLRVNYNYMERYLLSASIRAEGSSRFGNNHKWGWFPAASVGWRIAGEPFMRDQDWCQELKVRFGFGITGNNVGSDLQSKQLLTNGGSFWYNNQWVTTYTVGWNDNPDLRWEKKYEYNLGIDFSFLQDRLSGTLDLYYRDTKDLLWYYDVPTPPFQYSTLLANCGEITSKGLELSLTGVPVKQGNWTWTSTWTMAFNDNKIKKLAGDVTLNGQTYHLAYSEQLCGAVGENGLQGVTTQKIVEGESVGTFYGYKVTGIDMNNNLVYEKDESGHNKMQKIGNAQPLMTFGWNNTIRWKDLDITLFFRGVVGNDVLNVKRWAYGPRKSQGLNVFMKDVAGLADYTTVYRQGVFSDYYLEDGSFLKLDNITVGYTFHFPQSKYVRSLRLYGTAENVFTITSYSGIDPEVNTTSVWDSGIDASGFYPSTTNVIIGLNLNLL